MISLLKNVSKFSISSGHKMSLRKSLEGSLPNRFQSTLASNPAMGYISISKNMTLRYCNSRPQKGVAKDQPNPDEVNQVKKSGKSNKLVVFMSWMLAKDRHLEKYRKIYFKHGFDVLTVKTRPLDLMFPKRGSHLIGAHLLDYLKSQIANYPNIVIHGFSVGAYQFAEMLVKLKEGLNREQVDAECDVVKNNTKGMVFDSAVSLDYVPNGFSRALFGENALASMAEGMLKCYLKIFYNVATKHYELASKTFHAPPIRCPSLLLVSHDDKVGNPRCNTMLANKWTSLGIPVTFKCWDESKHVSHIHKYPAEYETEIDHFLQCIQLDGK